MDGRVEEKTGNESYREEGGNLFIVMAAHRRYPCVSKRREANRRERLRMQRMNEAFRCLRKALFEGEPPLLSRVDTLRLSIDYISSLYHLLNPPSFLRHQDNNIFTRLS